MGLTLNDTNDKTMQLAYLVFDKDTYSADLLAYPEATAVEGIVGSFDARTGTMWLEGVAPIMRWQYALRTVVYKAREGLSLKDRPNEHWRGVTIGVVDANGDLRTSRRVIHLKTARTTITMRAPVTRHSTAP